VYNETPRIGIASAGTEELVMRKWFLVCWLPLLTGCLASGERAVESNVPPPASGADAVAFVANGAGDFHTLSANLAHVVAQTHASLQIETIDWSLGRRRYLADHMDHANHLLQGQRLAAQALAWRQACPARKIYLIGHSAGCAVILAAADALPPNSIERVILLAPSVCARYDLRTALRSARDGFDVFYSSEDRFVLGLGMSVVGTSDRGCRVAAGQYGFTPVIASDADAVLHSRLHQHAWDPTVLWSGNDGGHYGSIRTGFLKAYVLPLTYGERPPA
jgi:pimeloyl-ACP methyl ester carboxylesterase